MRAPHTHFSRLAFLDDTAQVEAVRTPEAIEEYLTPPTLTEVEAYLKEDT